MNRYRRGLHLARVCSARRQFDVLLTGRCWSVDRHKVERCPRWGYGAAATIALSWPVTAAPLAERPTVGHDADRLTMDASLMASQ